MVIYGLKIHNDFRTRDIFRDRFSLVAHLAEKEQIVVGVAAGRT